jgi:hypothetical protein
MSPMHVGELEHVNHNPHYRLKICLVSCFILIICAVVFLSNICHYQTHTDVSSNFPIQFISTQMGACLVEYPIITWGFVFSIIVQMLLLFHLFVLYFWENDFSLPPNEKQNEKYISRCSWCMIGFITNIAGVAEFRSIGISQSEHFLHYICASFVMASFGYTHFSISMCLDDKYYMMWTYVYLVIFFLMMVLMISYFQTGQLLDVTIVLEWFLLFLAVNLQLYAEFTLQKLRKNFRKKKKQLAVTKHYKHIHTFWIFLWFLFTVGLAICYTPPWFIKVNIFGYEDIEYLKTGPEYWSLVIFGNCVLVLIS